MFKSCFLGLFGFLTEGEESLGVVSWGGGLVGGGVSVSLSWLWWVDWGSLVGDISNESVDVVSGVLGGLDSAVGESDHEASSNNTVGVLGLGLLEVGLAVVIGDSVLISERLGWELLLLVWSWLVSWRSISVVGSDVGHEGSGDDDLK